jgi:hypothetical protein
MSGLLNHTPAMVVRKLLRNLGYGTEPENNQAWPIYYSFFPDQPDNAIAIYDTTGRLEGRNHVDGETTIHHGIQVVVRSIGTDSNGRRKAEAIHHAFDSQVGHTNVSLTDEEHTSTYGISAINNTTDVIPLPRESPTSQRRLYTLNAVVSMAMITASYSGTGSGTAL